MKHALVSLLMVIVLAIVPVLGLSAIQTERPVEAQEVEQTLPNLPTVTIQLPGQTVTVKPPPVTVQGPTQTVEIPGPTRTVLIEQATETVTIPGPTQTRTERVEAPTETVTERETERITVSPSGQDDTDSGTLEPGTPVPSDDDGISLPDITLSRPEVVVVSLITVLLLAGLIILGMWSGYYMGFRDRSKKEADFLRALLKRKG